MLDVLNWAGKRVAENSTAVLSRFGLEERKYLLVTVHRSENTDHPERLLEILQAFDALGEPLVFPVHPRARKMIAAASYRPQPHVHLIEPVGYLEMVALTRSARRVLTDS